MLDAGIRFVFLLRHQQGHIPFNTPSKIESGTEVVIFCHGSVEVDAGICRLPFDVARGADAVVEIAMSIN